MTILSTCPALARALEERNYTDLTPVQTAVLESAADGRDLLVSAQTGSGKTVAFGLAIAGTLLGEAEMFGEADAPLALIVAPTRELALQVQRELAWLYAHTKARIVSCVGGMDPKRERRQLEDGAHIVVGTPGRLRDHMERRALDISNLQAVVLDEADEMLDLGFREDIEFILEATPAERRTLLFSATMPKGIVHLAKHYQRDALRVEVANGERGHADIEYRAVRVMANEVELAVVNVLRYNDSQCSIVFCNTREAVRHLQATLLERGFSAVLLSGELSQHERNHALQALRDGRAQVCVATDVAARGIDLPNLGLVIHAELPNDAEVLQHRSGRTGRAGKKGISTMLVTPARRRKAEYMLSDIRVNAVWSGPPSAEDIQKLDQERLVLDPLLTQESTPDELEMAQTLLSKSTPEAVAAALVRMYRSKLPPAEDVSDPGTGRDSRPLNKRDKGRDRDSAPRGREGGREAGGYEGGRREGGRREGGREGGTGVWFRLDIGRDNNADPKWLLPMICRRGNIDKNDVGAIRIFDRETKFEIAAGAAEQFARRSAKPDADDIRIEPVDGAPAQAPRERKPHRGQESRGYEGGRGKKPFADKPAYAKKNRDKPVHDDPYADRPPAEKPVKEKPITRKPFKDNTAGDKPAFKKRREE